MLYISIDRGDWFKVDMDFGGSGGTKVWFYWDMLWLVYRVPKKDTFFPAFKKEDFYLLNQYYSGYVVL